MVTKSILLGIKVPEESYEKAKRLVQDSEGDLSYTFSRCIGAKNSITIKDLRKNITLVLYEAGEE